jgi:hypothetical protein
MEVTWPDVFLRHFTSQFGKPFDVQLYRNDTGEAVRLATFDRAYPNYRVYASLGLSAHGDDLKGIGEAIVLADDPGKDVPLIFVNALFFIFERRIAIASRFAIGGVEMVNPDFAEYFNKAAIYFSPAQGFRPGFETVSWNQETGAVSQGIFISWSEQDFLNRNGPDALEDRLRGQESDPCSLRRPPCV